MIVEQQYFPCIAWCKNVLLYDEIKIEMCERFQKMSFRNRCVVVGSAGVIHLSVPIVGGRSTKRLVNDIKIDYSQNWNRKHWATIASCYGAAPFFDNYAEDVRTLLQTKHIFLIDLNWAITEWLLRIFKNKKTLLSKTQQYVPTYSDTIFDARNKWLPKNFKNESYERVHYQQIFEPKIAFQKNVSILDLLFCVAHYALTA